MTIKIILEDGAKMPKYATDGSAAVDLVANIAEEIKLAPQQVAIISTGIKVDMTAEPNLCAEVMPRSGMGKKGLVLANTIGLIDNDYQGEIMIMAFNRNPVSMKAGMGFEAGASITIEPGMRIAQMKFSTFAQAEFKEVKDFDEKTARGEGKFGSTGTK